MTRRSLVLALVAAALFTWPRHSSGETYKLVGSDGTVHYTNTPADPAYRRMGIAPPRAEQPAVRPVSVPGEGVDGYVRDAAARYGVPEKLVTAVIRAESGFNPRALSPKGARGLMQLMPQTASLLGVRDSFDPAENIDAGVRHLRGLMERFGNNLPLALAAYNAGEQAVTLHRGIPPYPETQGYVQKVLWLFNGDDPRGAAASSSVYPTYHYTDDDGTVVYSNMPPRSTARLVGPRFVSPTR